MRPDAGTPERAWRTVARLFGGETADPERDGPPGAVLPHVGREPARGFGGSAEDAEAQALPPELDEARARVEPERLEAEYVRLFVNALPEVPCPPYASAELEGVLYGQVTGQLRELYRRWGVETHRVPDHFAVETAFLAGLLTAARHDDAAARDVEWLVGHLRSWAPAFLRRVEVHDRTGFWAGAARWARRLLDEVDAEAPVHR